MSTYIYEPDAFDEPTIWRDASDGRPVAILARWQVKDDNAWRIIVAALCGEIA